MWIVVSLFIVVYASLASAYRVELVPIATEVFYKNGVKHERSRYKIVHPTSDHKPNDLHNGKLEHSIGDEHLYSNDNNYNFPKKNERNYKLQHNVRTQNHNTNLKNLYAPRVNNAHDEYLEHNKIRQYSSGNSQIQSDPTRHSNAQVKSIYQNYKPGKCFQCGSNAIRTKTTSISHATVDLSSSEAEGKIILPTVTNEAVFGSGLRAPEYVKSLKKQNSHQGINTGMIWKSMLNGTTGTPGTQQNSIRTRIISALRDVPDLGTPEHYAYIEKLKAEENTPLQPDQEITNETDTEPYPNTSQYITSVLNRNINTSSGIQQKILHNRFDSILHNFPKQSTPEYIAYIERLKAEGKILPRPGQVITYEAVHEPKPDISKYISSVLKQNINKGTAIRTHWKSMLGTTSNSPAAEKFLLQPEQGIINESATEPSTTDHLNSIQHQINEISTQPVKTNKILISGSYSEDTDENIPTHPVKIDDATDGPDKDIPWHIIHSIKIPDPYINAINEENRLNDPKSKTEDNITQSSNTDLIQDLQPPDEHGYYFAQILDGQPTTYVPNASDTSLNSLNDDFYTLPLSHTLPDIAVPENKAANKKTLTADYAEVKRVPIENFVNPNSDVDQPKLNLVPTTIPTVNKIHDVTLNQELLENFTGPTENVSELTIPQTVNNQLNFGSFLDDRTYNPSITKEKNVGPIENQNLPQNNLEFHSAPVIDDYYNPDRSVNAEENSSNDLTQESKVPKSEVELELVDDDYYEHEPVLDSVINYPNAVNDEIVLLDGELVHEPIIASDEIQESKVPESENEDETSPDDDNNYERGSISDSNTLNDKVVLVDGKLIHEPNVASVKTHESKAPENEVKLESFDDSYYDQEPDLNSVGNYPNAANEEIVILDGELVHAPIIATDENQESSAPEIKVETAPVYDNFYEPEIYLDSVPNYPNAVNEGFVFFDEDLVHEPKVTADVDPESKVQQNYVKAKPRVFKTSDDYYQHKQLIHQNPKTTNPIIVNENNYKIQNSYVAIQSDLDKLHIFVPQNKNSNANNNSNIPFLYSAYLKSIQNGQTLPNLKLQDSSKMNNLILLEPTQGVVDKQNPNRVNRIPKVYSSILPDINFERILETQSAPEVIQYHNYYQNFIFRSKESSNVKSINSLIRKFTQALSNCQSGTSKNKLSDEVDDNVAKHQRKIFSKNTREDKKNGLLI